ncbi:MAG: hypothetical protein IJK39_06635 [Bacteroidales bacterium]|jgi:hypothetical protein|nr:hypothetical protein [Bacteroidales bacterium]MBR6972991.1 hypothetical protein [Bacteroidales bacterium]
MEKNNFSRPVDEGLGSSIRKYLYMQVDRAALKGAEKMSVVSNRVIVITILLLTGTIVLMMLCLAAGFFLGDLFGSNALGFLCSAAIVLILGVVIWLSRKRLFANQMARFYTGMLLGDEKLSSMRELNLKQQFVETEIKDKEEDIAIEYQMLKKMLNPLHYVGLVIDKIRDIFQGKADDGDNDDIRPEEGPGNDSQDNYQARQF